MSLDAIMTVMAGIVSFMTLLTAVIWLYCGARSIFKFKTLGEQCEMILEREKKARLKQHQIESSHHSSNMEQK